MFDAKKKLVDLIVGYSIDVQKGEKVKINTQTLEDREFLMMLIDGIVARGGVPFVEYRDSVLANYMVQTSSDERISLIQKMNEFEVDHFDSFISIHYNVNDYEGKNIPTDIQKKYGKALLKSSEIRVDKRKWVLLNYPSSLDAYKAHMPISEFQKFAFDVMSVDYRKMGKLVEPLKKLMDKTDKVHIVSPGTDLTFSIKGMSSIPCTGDKNIPDGELYSAPIKTSVNGKITYNTPSSYQGNVYENVCLEFKDGKIVNATCSGDDKSLNAIFDTDEGARYVGEFSLGFNPMILHPMGDILFDEKILGSLHFTPGKAYADCYNGNDSAIHWDMVLIQREEYGGGEIYFDDVLIRKNGKFVLDELKPLNFEK